jgi:hypothetical protein
MFCFSVKGSDLPTLKNCNANLIILIVLNATIYLQILIMNKLNTDSIRIGIK